MSPLFRTKEIDALIAESEHPDRALRKTLGPWQLTALGIGAVIGSGIFILTGTAAAGEVKQYESVWNATVMEIIRHGGAVASVGRPGAGPGIALSFFLVAIACGFAALCYAELASMIPIAGSAYTYAYATLGEIFAWVVGWQLVLEYAVSNMAVAVGFAAHVNDVLSRFGWQLPAAISEPMFKGDQVTGHINVMSLIILLLLTWLLVRGVKEGTTANNVMVAIKLAVILLFVVVGSQYTEAANWNPMFPNGASGVLTGAAIVFFSYIGFDSVSTAAEECKNPQRDLPFGIIASLVICAVLYCSVAVVLTGMTNWTKLNTAAPVVEALAAKGLPNVRWLVGVGALFGMVSSLLVFQYGQSRIWYAMSRDGLLPRMFSKIHPRYRTPHVSTWIAGFLVGIPSMFGDIGTFADLANMGTLFAFSLVSAGVLVLRKRMPERPRGFRVPWVPLIPLLAIGSCVVLMMSLTLLTWFRFLCWFSLGLVLYFFYGRHNSVEALRRAR
jgi:basic amino acid/polyamine antiporter, APA family